MFRPSKAKSELLTHDFHIYTHTNICVPLLEAINILARILSKAHLHVPRPPIDTRRWSLEKPMKNESNEWYICADLAFEPFADMNMGVKWTASCLSAVDWLTTLGDLDCQRTAQPLASRPTSQPVGVAVELSAFTYLLFASYPPSEFLWLWFTAVIAEGKIDEF